MASDTPSSRAVALRFAPHCRSAATNFAAITRDCASSMAACASGSRIRMTPGYCEMRASAGAYWHGACCVRAHGRS